jgi:hypothetical protein
MSNLALSSICSILQQKRLTNIPPSRIEVLSPYETTNYNRFDLDMRRKAQILKYDQLNTQVNNISKKEKWSRLVNRRNPSLNTVFDPEKNIIVQVACPNIIGERNVRMPLSASNVPPDPNVSYLYNDETVPLYNYINPNLTRSYGIQNKENPNMDFDTTT